MPIQLLRLRMARTPIFVREKNKSPAIIAFHDTGLAFDFRESADGQTHVAARADAVSHFRDALPTSRSQPVMLEQDAERNVCAQRFQERFAIQRGATRPSGHRAFIFQAVQLFQFLLEVGKLFLSGHNVFSAGPLSCPDLCELSPKIRTTG